MLFNSTLNTPSEPYFLSILQHLLTIRDDVFSRYGISLIAVLQLGKFKVNWQF